MDTFGIIIATILIAICLTVVLFHRNKKVESLKKNGQSENLSRKYHLEKSVKNEFFYKKGLDKQKKIELTKIIEIVLQNSLGQDLSFTRPNESSSVKYQEVMFGELNNLSGHIAQGVLPTLGHNMYLKEIAKAAPNGLFTTTANPAMLSKFADQSYSTMVRDSANNLVAHEGFIRTGLHGTNPLLAVNVGMQAMAAISGQYYLDHINSGLDTINSNLEKLVSMHHDEKIGILLNAKIRLGEIISRETIDESDVNEIRSLRNKTREVYQEYKIRLDREQESVSIFKSKAWFVEERVNGYSNSIDEMCFTMQVTFEADRLSMQAELAEIAVRMKRNYKDAMLEELFNQLKNNYKNSFSISINDKIDSIFIPINENAKNIVGNGKDFWLIDKNQKELLQSILNKPKYLQENLTSKTDENIFTTALLESNKTQEFLIMPDNDLQVQRIFIPINA